MFGRAVTTVLAGQTFEVLLRFKRPKVGWVGIYGAGFSPVFAVEGPQADWAGWQAQAVCGVATFTNVESATLELQAPHALGAYSLVTFVPADGGTLGIDALTVTSPQASRQLTLSRGVPALQPSFSAEDIARFVRERPHKYWDRSQPPPTVEAISFLPYRNVAEHINGRIGIADDALVCVVSEVGSFVKATPFGARRTFAFAYRLFDAETGNFLGLGLRDSARLGGLAEQVADNVQDDV